MSETSLVSVVEDDPSFRDSMRRLMRSLGFNVEAADFLASPRLIETAWLGEHLRSNVIRPECRLCRAQQPGVGDQFEGAVLGRWERFLGIYLGSP